MNRLVISILFVSVSLALARMPSNRMFLGGGRGPPGGDRGPPGGDRGPPGGDRGTPGGDRGPPGGDRGPPGGDRGPPGGDRGPPGGDSGPTGGDRGPPNNNEFSTGAPDFGVAEYDLANRLCANPRLAQSFLSEIRTLIQQLRINNAYARFIQQKAHQISYIESDTFAQLLSSDCLQYFIGFRAAQNADMEMLHQEQENMRTVEQLIRNIVTNILGGQNSMSKGY